jgi:ribosomal protein L35
MLKYLAKKPFQFFSNINKLPTSYKSLSVPNLYYTAHNTKSFFTKNIQHGLNSTGLMKSNILINYQKFSLRSMKSKRKSRAPDPNYKISTHHGLKKRIRIVGPRWCRAFKFWPSNHRHKMVNKSNANLASKKKPRYVVKAYIRRVKRLLPYFKRKKYKH